MGSSGHHFRRTTLLTCFCIALLAGLCIGRFQPALQPVALFVGLALSAIFIGRHRFLGLCGVLVLGLTLGCWRGADMCQRLRSYDPLYDQTVTLRLRANEDAVYGKNGQLKFMANGAVNVESGEKLYGSLGISGLGLNGIFQGDELLVTGKLRDGIGSYQGFMSYAKLELVEHHPSPVIELRRAFGVGMLNALPEPLASFSMGLLIGQRASLPEELKDDLQKVGLTHIIAVSGANLTIMLEASRKLLAKRSKRLATFLSLGLMLLFVMMTGGSASIVRAGFVSALSVGAAYYGRRTRPLLIISLVAAITAFINPIYVWSDASWHLSFLAFFGVLMVSPLFHSRLPKIFETNILLAIALESLCAEIMSLPYVLFTFGQMSYVGLLANVVIVSFIPYAMLWGFIAGLAGTFLWPVAGWFTWPAKFLLTYMLDTTRWLASWPGIFKDGVWLSATGVIMVYASIAVTVGLLSYKDKPKSGIITDEIEFQPHKILGRTS